MNETLQPINQVDTRPRYQDADDSKEVDDDAGKEEIGPSMILVTRVVVEGWLRMVECG